VVPASEYRALQHQLREFEIGCDNGEKVRITFTLDCCDREVISWVVTTGGIDSSDIRDL
jgi:putative transposase